MKIVIIQFINYTLSFLMWMIIGRYLLTLIMGGRENAITGIFKKITEPVYLVTRTLLPFAKEGWLPVLSIVLIVVVRLTLIIVFQPAMDP